MILFIIRPLLMILLLQPAAGNDEWKTAEPDTSVSYEEFCIRIPDDPPSTSSKPVSQTPTTTAHPPKNPVKPKSRNLVSHFQPEAKSGCYCNDGNMKQPTETSRILVWAKRHPSEMCSITEYIETLADGRQVCVRQSSWLTSIGDVLRAWLKTTTPPVMIPTPPPPVRDIPTLNIYCGDCNSFNKNYPDIDLRAMQSLDVKMPLHCPAQININMNDGRVYCVKLIEFQRVLQNLEILPPYDECPPNSIADGCRCQETTKDRPPGRIWLPSDNCPSTEVMETQVDGTEVCKTICDPYQYFRNLTILEAERSRPPGPPSPPSPSDPPGEHGPRGPIGPCGPAGPDGPSGPRGPPGPPDSPGPPGSPDPPGSQGPPGPKGSAGTRGSPGVVKPTFNTGGQYGEVGCRGCVHSKDLKSIDPKDVASLEINLPSPACHGSIWLTLTNTTKFCMDSSMPQFKDVLEKLENQPN
ncbi:uncharacterized protein LOC125014716 isoform X2 [Mugil cephalus]|uniref:uncharacterized protein LOC125014716 isoform X2 n=1 Tax=Mugil cephalus TaxID=48193 RepID=UPI001FB61037|nr:uncharacterized protein LOC125014716 isoform X2 [Mugil cephalus]